MNTVSDKEKQILENIDYASKYLHIKEKYADEGKVYWLYQKNEILQAFKELGHSIKYVRGGAYIIEKYYNNYRFEYRFVISMNNFSIYLEIYKNNAFIENQISNMGYILRFIPYNAEFAAKLNERGFILESVDNLKNYISDIISLLDEFVNEYIKDV
jgi:hypothetical protein